MSATHTYGQHLSQDPNAEIRCETQEHPGKPNGYPVLHIGDAMFWPTVGQLRAIRNAIEAWLITEGERLDPVGAAEENAEEQRILDARLAEIAVPPDGIAGLYAMESVEVPDIRR